MFQISDYLVPNHIEIPNLVVETTDLGGDGDCLIRCFREALKGSVTVEPSEDIYKTLSLPQGTYLEDTHLSMLANSYSATVFVLRIHGDSAVIQHYRPEDPVHSICLVNYHPNHFVLADFQVDNEPITAMLEFPVNLNPEWNLVLDGEERVFKSILMQAGDFLQSDVEEKILLPASVVVPTADIAVLYSYLLDTNLMVVQDLATAMDMYYQCHHVLLDFLKTCQEEHKLPPRPFFKAYYKFRHNIFSALCLISMGLVPSSLGTDMEIRKWVPLSNKTPDFVTEDETRIVLWEFTVGNNYESVDFLKGGGNFDLKYSQECSLIEKASGKTATVKVVPCVLDINNADEILSLLGLEITKESRGLFLDFMNIANTGRSQISHSYTASMVATDKIQEPNLYLELSYDREPIPKIQLFDAEFLSKLVASNSALVARATSLSLRSSKKHSLGYDVDNHRFFFVANLHGMPMDWWVSTLGSKHLSEILSNMRFYSNSKEVSKDRVKGTVPVMSSSKESPYKAIRWSADSYVEDVYNSRTAVYNPGYGEPESMDDSSLLERFVSDKVAFPAHYMRDLVNMDSFKMLEYDGESMLANCRVTLDGLTHVIEQFSDAYKMANSDFTFRPKQTFMVPLATEPMQHVGLDQLPNHMFQLYIEKGSGKYTRTVCKKAVQSDFMKPDTVVFTEAVKASLEDFQLASATYHSKLIELGKPGHTTWKDCTEEERGVLQPYKQAMIKKSKAYKSSLKMGRGTISPRMVSLRCSKSSVTRQHYDAEMEHFGNRGSYGVGYPSASVSEEAGDYFHSLSRRLFETEFHHNTFPELYGRHRSVSPQLLTDIKNRYTERWDLFSDRFFKGTLCQQLTFLASNLANFLLSESVKNHNSTRLKVDNLGFSDFAVICRGGPKIFKNQTSKLYRAMFFIDSQDLKMSGYQENPTFEVIKTQGRYMVVTPWSTIRQDILFDMLSLPYTTFNFLFSSYTRTYPNFDMPIPELLSLPVILSLHNRRKTESLMHNCRYLVVNLLGENANLAGIIKGFATFNYTYLDCWLKNRIRDGYLNFAESLMALREAKRGNIESLLDSHRVTDLWFGKPITTADQLTLFIYITYMMSKAPVNGSIEQSLNLWEVLEDVVTFDRLHGDVEGMKDYSLRSNVLNFNAEDYADDFKYDPVFCQFQGHYLSGYLSNLTNRSDLECVWNRIEQEDLGVIANSNGLRGWDKTNFFGKKGYEVVYKDIEASTGGDELENMFLNYLKSDPITSANTISADRNSLIDSEGFDKLLFHIVHKIQRGGNREIYCMDLNTKRKQYPIEKFLKHVCKMIPNEFISIPSNKRHSMIHSDFYEKPIGPWVKSVKRWVLDCRRWAPHSVFQKYIHFVHGLSPILPPDFLEKFYLFADGMFTKQFVTREHVLSKMRSNERFKKYSHLVKDMNNISNAFTMTVRFSFVMGIFNYLSTLMHSANQLVASEVIRSVCLRRGLGLVVLDPKCHSDDSVVSSYHEQPSSLPVSVKIYDWLLKSANHMLSVKKSQVNNNVYLEFLSILYLFDRFLPVFPKFISSIPFKPTDQGYSSDLSFAASQAMEMLTNGGSHEEAYLIMKTTAKFLSRIYNLSPIEGMPPQLFGSLDAHPVELLVSGYDSQIQLMFLYNPAKYWNLRGALIKLGLIKEDDISFSLDWDMGAMLTQSSKTRLNEIGAIIAKHPEIEWTVSNSKLGNGKLNLLWYYNKLKDRKFSASITQEPEARRYSRIFGAAGYRRIRSGDGTLNQVEQVYAALSKLTVSEDYTAVIAIEEIMQYSSSQLADFHRSISETEIVEKRRSNVKDKPVVFKTGAPHLGNISISAVEYVSYLKEPQGFKLLGRYNNPRVDAGKITETLEILGLDVSTMSKDNLYKMARRLLNLQEKQYRIVSPLPGNMKIVDSHSATLGYLEYCSYSHTHMITKNTHANEMDWSRRMLSGKLPRSAEDYMKSYWTCKILNDYDLLDKDIFTHDIRAKERALADQLPQEWKLVLLTSLSEESTPLCQINYWTYWEREQIKLGRRWVGAGICVVKTPEAVFRVKVSSGAVIGLEIETNHSGFFSSPTSWYLNNVFKYSGLTAEFTDTSYVDKDKYYFGYLEKDHSFGYGRARMFDFVVGSVTESNELIPKEFYTEMKRERVGAHYKYKSGEASFYIDFFVPMEDPVTISFKNLLDTEKMKDFAADEGLIRFLQKMSVDIGGVVMVDKVDLIENLGGTLLYKVLFEAPSRDKILRGEKVDDYMIEAFESWKSYNPDFGYPSREQMKELAAQDERPAFPNAVIRRLNKVGVSSIPEADFKGLISKLNSLDQEEQLQFLASNYSYLDTSMRTNMLTVALRSKIFYKSCNTLGEKALPFLIPLCDVITSAIATGDYESRLLLNMKRELKQERNIVMHSSDIYKHLFLFCIARGLTFRLDTKHFKPFQNLYEITKELWKTSIKSELNITPTTDPVLRSIDFNVAWETFGNMLTAVFSSHFQYNYREFNKLEKFSISDNSEFVCLKSHWKIINSYFRKGRNSITLLSERRKSKGQTIRYTKKQILSVTKKLEPGPCKVAPYQTDEDGREEWADSWTYEPDLHEIADPDPDADRSEIPDVAFVECGVMSLIQAGSLRNTAWNLYIKTEQIDNTVLEIYGERALFQKINYWNNLSDYFGRHCDYILYIGIEGTNCNIEGYRRVPWEQEVKIYSGNQETENTYLIDGKFYSYREVASSPILQGEIVRFDNYFKKVNEADLNPEMQRVKELLDAHSEFEKNETVQKMCSELEAMINNRKLKESDSTEGLGFDLAAVLDKMGAAGLFNTIASGIAEAGQAREPIKEYIRARSSVYKYEEPMKVLTDPEMRAQFESLLPGYMDKIMNNEIRISSRTKKRIIEFAKGQISKMPEGSKRIYRRLLFLIRVVLNSIEECRFRQNESFDFVACIDQLFMEGEDEEELDTESIADLIPDSGSVRLRLDLSRIL
nr:MAG: RNA-dependent RNA polymerase [Sanya bunya-like virus 13]